MRFICSCLLIVVPCFACHQPRLEGSRAGHCSTATTTSSGGGGSSSIAGRGTARWSWCKVSRVCICWRFLWVFILIAVPCFTCHQPRLEESRASRYRTTTSSGGGSGGCIAG
ncbi:hypothetical protein PF001_g27872 [Phytophthora fragariae]|uniref:RxLR effector protein n=1 Tax=Phytophthora fragariae TaxID=53985 RepID=A0A6A4BC66_9STRA|nr:hypothetical protein PF006_g29063 [Phytophthora fragariae]KAE9272586.1 hypothetical protein PF001_g27871 [Phytophthora fragariae]KAE9272588.1 hypothetical protein PF001_g27872 [Phytophthora fragariae]